MTLPLLFPFILPETPGDGNAWKGTIKRTEACAAGSLKRHCLTAGSLLLLSSVGAEVLYKGPVGLRWRWEILHSL